MSARPCPVCGAADAAPLIELPRAPVYPVARPGGGDERLFDLAFAGCERCGHVYNASDARAAMRRLVSQDVPWFVPVTQGQLDSAAAVATWLGSDLFAGRRVLEIGGGWGALSRAIARDAGEVVLVEPNRGYSRDAALPANLRVVEGAFPEDVPAGDFDLVVCQQVVCQVPEPIEFLTAVRDRLAPGGALFVGTERGDAVVESAPPASFGFQSQGIFTDASLDALLARCGFAARRRRAFGKNVGVVSVPVDALRDGEGARAPAPGWAARLRSRLAGRRANGARRLAAIGGGIALYGASGGAQALLGLYPDIDARFALDDTPDFTGLEIPRDGDPVPIVAPDVQVLTEIDAIVTCAHQHDAAIAERVRGLGFEGEVLSLRVDPGAPDPVRPPSLFA